MGSQDLLVVMFHLQCYFMDFFKEVYTTGPH